MSKVSFQIHSISLQIFITLFVFSTCIFAQNSSGTASITVKIADNTKEEPARPRIVREESPDFAETSKDTLSIFTLERMVFELINRKRSEIGLSKLEWNETLAKIARLHSENMAKTRHFSHVGIDGKMVDDRADDLGFSNWRAIGENIAYNRGFQNPIDSAVAGWLNSSMHRENLMSNRWKETGVGISVTDNGTYYFTQVFVVRR